MLTIRDSVLVTCLGFVLLSVLSEAKKLKEANEENCEVCVKFMSKFVASLDSGSKSDQKKIEAAFRQTCEKSIKDDNRLCYYIGGLETSATSIIQEMSKPVSWGMPVEKVCYKLYQKDSQICDLRYEKSADLANLNFQKLKVNDLKNILSEWNEQCKGCTEKSEYVRLVKELMPKYAPDAWKILQQKGEL